MKKYRCPKCGTMFVGKLTICPTCSQELHYLDEEVKNDQNVAKQTFHFDDEDVLTSGIEEVQTEEIKKEQQTKEIEKQEVVKNVKRDSEGNPLSYYDGNWFAEFGLRILATLMTICTVFIALPWAMCIVYRYQYKHTIIDGRRLYFDGKGIQLFGRYMLWLLLTIVTIGIFSIFMLIRLKKWKTKHTHITKNAII